MSILASDRNRNFCWAAIITLLSGSLYFCTAARDIIIGDTPEFVTAAVTLGVAHPSGYPLLTMLGHLFSLLPVGPIPFRVNLLSVICDSVSVGLVFVTALRLNGSRPAAAAAALLLATSPIFWSWSLATEVFALNNLLASLLVYLLVRWREQPESARLLVGVSFVAGLALANHQTIVFLLPAVGFVIWQRGDVWRDRPKLIAGCVVVFVLGFLPYAYVPWASAHHPFHNWGNVQSIRDLFGLIVRESYGMVRLTTLNGFGLSSLGGRVLALFLSFGLWMGPLILLGLIWAWRRKPWYFWFSVIAFGGTGLFFVMIANLDLVSQPSALYVLERFFLLPQVVLAPLVAPGLLVVSEAIAMDKTGRQHLILRVLACAIFIATAVGVWVRYRQIDQKQNHVARFYAEDILASVPSGAILFITGDEVILPLVYLQSVEHVRPDVTLVIMPLLRGDWYLRQLKAREQNLNLPFTHYDPANANLRALIDANTERRLFLVRTIPDDDSSLSGKYWLYPHGVVFEILPLSTEVDLQQTALENQQLLERYRIPDFRAIKRGTFEDIILYAYVEPALRMGVEYERIANKQEAAKWFHRALEINPDWPFARERLARIED